MINKHFVKTSLVYTNESLSLLSEWDRKCSHLQYAKYFDCCNLLYDKYFEVKTLRSSDNQSFLINDNVILSPWFVIIPEKDNPIIIITWWWKFPRILFRPNHILWKTYRNADDQLKPYFIIDFCNSYIIIFIILILNYVRY